MTGWSWKRTPPEFPPPGSTISILSEGSTCRSNTDAHRAIVCYNIANDPVPYMEKECWCASYLIPLFQFLIEHWSDSFPWWRLCEQSVLINMKHTLIVTHNSTLLQFIWGRMSVWPDEAVPTVFLQVAGLVRSQMQGATGPRTHQAVNGHSQSIYLKTQEGLTTLCKTGSEGL